MPGKDTTQNLFQSQFSGHASDWSQISGGVLANFTAVAQLRRGFNLELGVAALAQLDAGLAKFVMAKVHGDADAKAMVQAQVQYPLNLFGDAGLAIRLQATAEAAAGASLEVGLSIGDFIKLVQGDATMAGLPAKLFELFMDEVQISAGYYAKAAASAMAYATIVAAGRAVPGPNGETPGFTILADAGAGLEAGAGTRIFVSLGIADFRRFITRTIDVVVDSTLTDLQRYLHPDDTERRTLLLAMRAPAKIALRAAYELGNLLVTRVGGATAINNDAAGARQLALRCTQMVLEEAQRYLLERITSAGLELFRERLASAGVSTTDWDATSAQRTKLVDLLRQLPDEPFVWNDTNRTYWENITASALDIAAALYPKGIPPNLLEAVSLAWAGHKLLFVAMGRAGLAGNNAFGASFSVIGIDPKATRDSFTGVLDRQPPLAIKQYIHASLRHASGILDLTLDDLLQFLVAGPLLDDLGKRFPDVAKFIGIFRGALGSSAGKILLSNVGALALNGQAPDSPATLQALLTALRDFLHLEIASKLVPEVDARLQERPDLRLYFDEAIIPSMNLAIDVVFTEVLQWTSATGERERFEEALSSVLLMLTGRSVVITADILGDEVRKQTKVQLNRAADAVGQPGGFGDVLQALTGRDRSDVVAILTAALRIGGDVFGPLPPTTRATIRELMYEIFKPLPPTDQRGFFDSLADEQMLPKPETVKALAQQLAALAGQNLTAFINGVAIKTGELMLQEFEQVLVAAEQAIASFVRDLQKAWDELKQALADLARALEELERQLADAVAALPQQLQSMLGALSNSALRQSIRADIRSRLVSSASGVLFNNLVYRVLPADAQRDARNLLESAIDGFLDNSLVNSAGNAVGAVAWDVNDFLNDARAMDPSSDWSTNIVTLLLNRVEQQLRARFPGDPGLPLKFTVAVRQQVWNPESLWNSSAPPTITISVSKTIDLGQINLPLSDFIAGLRYVISLDLTLLAAIRDLAAQVKGLLDMELQKAGLMRDQSDKTAQQPDLDLQVRESQAGALSLQIVEPACTLYQSSVPVRINLGGAPLSFTGLGNWAQQRAFVWINHRPIAMTVFNIREHAQLGAPRTVVPARPTVGGTGAVTPPAATGAVATNPGGVVGAKTGTAAPSVSLLGLAASMNPSRVAAATKSAFAQSAGRRPGLDDLAASALSLPAGVLLEAALPQDYFQPGLNTLVVYLTDGRGQKLRAAASFWFAPPPAKSPAPVVTPDKTGKMRAANRLWFAPQAERVKAITGAIEAVNERRVVLPSFARIRR